MKLTLPHAQQLLKDHDPQSLLSMLDTMENAQGSNIEHLEPLVLDIIKLKNQETAALILKRVLQLRPAWANYAIPKQDNSNKMPGPPPANGVVTGNQNHSVLMAAVWLNRFELVDILLAAGARITHGIDAGASILDTAIVGVAYRQISQDEGFPSLSMIDHLLGKCNFTEHQKAHALRLAATTANPRAVQSLLSAGAGFEAPAADRTALAIACFQCEIENPAVEMVRAMLKAPAGRQAIDTGWGHGFYLSPIHSAASEANIEVLSILIQAGACVNPPPGCKGRLITPLMVAASGTHLASLELLLRAGADASALDHRGANALHWLSISSADPEEAADKVKAMDLLLRAGADPMQVDQQGLTPAQVARDTGHQLLADALEAVVSATHLDEQTAVASQPGSSPGRRL